MKYATPVRILALALSTSAFFPAARATFSWTTYSDQAQTITPANATVDVPAGVYAAGQVMRIGTETGALGGYGATATATVSGGSVTSVTLTNGGQLYSTAPTVTLTASSGTQPVVTATLSNGVVTALNLISGGSGYAVGATASVSFTGGGGEAPATFAVPAGAAVDFVTQNLPSATVSPTADIKYKFQFSIKSTVSSGSLLSAAGRVLTVGMLNESGSANTPPAILANNGLFTELNNSATSGSHLGEFYSTAGTSGAPAASFLNPTAITPYLVTGGTAPADSLGGSNSPLPWGIDDNTTYSGQFAAYSAASAIQFGSSSGVGNTADGFGLYNPLDPTGTSFTVGFGEDDKPSAGTPVSFTINTYLVGVFNQSGTAATISLSNIYVNNNGPLLNSTVQSPPTISTQPVASQSVGSGGTATFTVAATNDTSFSYQWYFSDTTGDAPVALASQTNGDSSVVSGATTATLQISNLQAGEAGTYWAVVTGANAPIATSNSVLTLSSGTPPAITSNPANATALPGSSGTTFTVAASGAPTPSYQWYINTTASNSGGTILADGTDSAGNGVSGSATDTLTITSAQATAYYYAVASNGVGSAVTSTAASLTVSSNVAPVLTQQPDSRVVPVGASTSWQAFASGNPGANYVWTLNGSPISGATSYVYTVTSASSTDAGTYQVIASNVAGSATSSTWTLTVGSAPAITTQPTTQYVVSGGTANLSVVASSGAGILPVTGYQWCLDGVPLSNGGGISGATSSTLTISNVTSGSSPYQVNVLSVAGPTTSAGASVVVGTAPVLTQQPNSRVLPTGASTSWQAFATGNPGVTYAWTLNGTPISGATSFVYTVSSASGTDAGTYQVIATNPLGSASSSTWTLSVGTAAGIATQPTTQYVVSGGTANLSVVASSGAGILPVTGYQWTLDGVPLSNGAGISGATSSTLTLSNVTSGSNPYQVNVISAGGATTSVGVSVVVGTAPVLTQQPNSRVLPTGASTSWQAFATGNPGVTYAWTLNGSALSGATSFVYTVTSASSTDAGTYQVTATNPLGSASSSTWTLSVGSAPTISTQPTTQYVVSGGTANLSVVASSGAGILPVTGYQWCLDGVPVSNGGGISGATSSTLTISNATSGSNPYQVNVISAAGATTSVGVSVVVGTAPVLTQQPNSRVLPTGASTSWQAFATGNPGDTYVWTLGGSPISGATSFVYTVSSASSTDAGTYQVTATNALGSASSATWTLAVGAAPTISTQPAAVTADSGSTVSLSVGAGAVDAWPGTTSYQWLVNGTAINGATSATYSIGYVSQANSGNYSVQLTDVVGSVTSNSANVHVLAPVIAWSLGQVGTGAQGVISTTFTIPAGPSRTVLVAGLGPILGVGGVVSNPQIDLYNSTSVDVLTATGMATFNGNPGYQATTISAAHLHCAISLTVSSLDSEGLITLAPGSYTAVLSGAGATTGLGELAVYDLSNQAFTNTETTTQAPVVSPSGPLTEKFLVAGASSDTVIVAALGPGLTNKGITSPLSDPELTVSDQNSNVVGTNTNAPGSTVTSAELSELGYTVESGDSGLALTLAPGVYTAVSASASGSNSGVTEIDVLQQ